MSVRYHELLRGSLVGGPGKREEHRRHAIKIVALLGPHLGALRFSSCFPEATTKIQVSFVTCLV